VRHNRKRRRELMCVHTACVCVCAGNRRLDEWVPQSRFESLEKYGIDTYHNGLHSAVGLDLVEGGDRKITRNQKRKHDAINHVQTVLFILLLTICSR